jgi:hypothetical protein
VVDRDVGDGQQVVREHHLVQVAVAHPGHGRRDGSPVVGDRQPPVGVADRRGPLDRGDVGPGRVADRGDPAVAVAVAEHDLGHHQDGVTRIIRERHADERDRPAAGQADVVLDVQRGGEVPPPAVGVGEPVGARRFEPRGFTPSDQA